MRLLPQPRTIEPGRFLFNQFDLFLCDFKWPCEFTVSLSQEQTNGHSLSFGDGRVGAVYATLIRKFMTRCPRAQDALQFDIIPRWYLWRN